MSGLTISIYLLIFFLTATLYDVCASWNSHSNSLNFKIIAASTPIIARISGSPLFALTDLACLIVCYIIWRLSLTAVWYFLFSSRTSPNSSLNFYSEITYLFHLFSCFIDSGILNFSNAVICFHFIEEPDWRLGLRDEVFNNGLIHFQNDLIVDNVLSFFRFWRLKRNWLEAILFA